MRFLITNSVPLNGGDEALLRSTVETLRKRWPASEVMVLCKDVARCRAYLPDLYFASDLEWASSRRERQRTLDLYRAADLVLSAPGGFLSDYYGIEDRLRGFETALDLGKPVMLFAQSIGPFWKAESLRRVPQVLNRLTVICTRDEASSTHLLDCGVDSAKIHRTADAAFLWRDLDKNLFRTEGRQRQVAGLCFRAWPLGDKVTVRETIRKAEELCRHILGDSGWEVLFISTCQGIPGYVDDSLIALRVVANLPPELRARCRIDRSRHAPRELIRVLGQCSAFIGMRLHGCILAMLAGVPAAGLGYEEKTEGIFRQLGLEEYQIPFQSNASAWIECANRLFHDLARIRRRLPEALDALSARAQLTVDIVGDQLLRTTAPETVSAEQRWAGSVHRYDLPHLRLRQVAALVARLAPKRLLDVGCAAGHLQKLCPAGVEYVGCDFIPAASPVSFPLWRCNFNREPLPAELAGFDAIVCSGILEYIEDVPSFLETLCSRLSPGGHIIATYFNMNHVSRLWDMLRGRSFAVHPDWRNFYSLRHIPRIVAAAGFRVTATIAMKHSFGRPEAVEDLVSAPTVLPRSRWWSTWFAHQLIMVAQKSSQPNMSGHRQDTETGLQTQRRHPSVSVIIPCYNGEKWIARAIRSALNQRDSNPEIVVIDDGSTDKSLDVIKSFGDILRWKTGPNQGGCAARNSGLDTIKSEYVMFLDADDYIEADSLAEWTAGASGADIVLGPVAYETAGRLTPGPTMGPVVTANSVLRQWLSGRFVPPCAVLWRRSFLCTINGWNPAVLRNQDGEVTMRALLYGARVAIARRGLGVYVQHGHGTRVSKRTGQAILASELSSLESLWTLAVARGQSQLQDSFAGAFYRVAYEAFANRLDDIGRAALSRARQLGLKGHTGSLAHRKLSTIFGLRGKLRLTARLKGRRLPDAREQTQTIMRDSH